MWISRKKYKEMKQSISDLNANLSSCRYSLANRTEQLADYMLKVSELERELEEYKQKYADEVQKRLDLIKHVNNVYISSNVYDEDFDDIIEEIRETAIIAWKEKRYGKNL